MVAREQIQELCRRIVDGFHPERIILFGSYAYGVPDSDSDVDLLVVLPFEGKPAHKSAEIMAATSPGFPVVVIVRTPQELGRRISTNDFFLCEVTTRGQVLYEAAHG